MKTLLILAGWIVIGCLIGPGFAFVGFVVYECACVIYHATRVR